MIPSEMNPRVSILIATHNEARHIASTLESICEQDCPSDWLEVLVLDGNSTDDTVKIAQTFSSRLPNLKVIQNPGILSAAGWNLGLRLAQSPMVSILSGHVMLPTNYFSFILAEMSPERCGVGVCAVPIGDDKRSALIANAFSGLLGNGGASFMSNTKSGPVESIAFGCYWRQSLLDIGGFDERIVRGQDWDLNLRLRAKGLALWYNPQLEVRYFTRTSFAALWRRQFLAGRWKRYIHAKSGKPLLFRHSLPGAFVAGLVAMAALVPFWPAAVVPLITVCIAHITASIWQLRRQRLSWTDAPAFWWALWLIHVGYGAGMITSFAAPIRPVAGAPS